MARSSIVREPRLPVIPPATQDGTVTQGDRQGTSWPEQAAILLVAAPVALFFGVWFQPLLGIPAAATTLWAAWRLARGVVPTQLPSPRVLVSLAMIALVWTWIAGLGGFFEQMWDHNFRNALLHDLIDHAWPVLWQTPQGSVTLDYYLAWSLIPALVGKVLGWRAATFAMAAICAVGVFLVLLLFVRVVGAWRWWLPFVFLLWSGLDIVGWGLRREFDVHMAFIETWCYPPLWFLSHMINYFCVPHLALPTWLITFMVVGRRIGPRAVVGLSAFLFPLAPFQMVGLLPFVLWAVLQGDDSLLARLRRVFTPDNIVFPLVAFAMCAPLFLGNVGAGQGSGWFFENSPSSLPPGVIFVAFLGVEVLAVGFVVWLCGQKSRLVLLTLVVLCLIPLRQSGATNDFALKVPMAGLAVLTLFTVRAFLSKPRGWTKWLLVGVFALGAVTPAHEIWTAARYTLKDPQGWEADDIKTFDPAVVPKPIFLNFVVNFRSRPLEQLPLLRWMLTNDAGGL